jgi:hypothetical protein
MDRADRQEPTLEKQALFHRPHSSRGAPDTQELPGWNAAHFAAWLRTRPDLASMPRALQEAEYWEEHVHAQAEWAAAERWQESSAYAAPAWGWIRRWFARARSRAAPRAGDH